MKQSLGHQLLHRTFLEGDWNRKIAEQEQEGIIVFVVCEIVIISPINIVSPSTSLRAHLEAPHVVLGAGPRLPLTQAPPPHSPGQVRTGEDR